MDLSDRQIEVGRMVAAGKTAPQIAVALGIAVGTVRAHLQAVYRSLGITGGNPAKQLMLRPEILEQPK